MRGGGEVEVEPVGEKEHEKNSEDDGRKEKGDGEDGDEDGGWSAKGGNWARNVHAKRMVHRSDMQMPVAATPRTKTVAPRRKVLFVSTHTPRFCDRRRT